MREREGDRPEKEREGEGRRGRRQAEVGAGVCAEHG